MSLPQDKYSSEAKDKELRFQNTAFTEAGLNYLKKSCTAPISIGLQIAKMRRLFPDFKYQFEKGKHVWIGTLQPGEYSPGYRVKMVYSHGIWPKVWVIKPVIKQSPHTYPDGSLCLFYPKDFCWHKGVYLAETIVPWTAEWLFFYELWQETDKWLGREKEHLGEKEKFKIQNER